MVVAPNLALLLVDAQNQFDWPIKDTSYQIAREWQRERSGTTFYRLVGSPSGQSVVVKTGVDWRASDAHGFFSAMQDLHRAIEKSGVAGENAIMPFAWIEGPPAVAMPEISGTDVISILRDATHSVWADGGKTIHRWVAGAGSMLSAYHHSSDMTDDRSSTIALDDAIQVARRLRIPPKVSSSFFDDLDLTDRLGPVYGDIGPGNLMGEPDGNLWLIDPPIGHEPGLIHRDLGNFLFELRRQIAGRGFTPSDPVDLDIDQLTQDFLTGYANAAQIDLQDSGNLGLIAIYQMRRAVGMARKRFPKRPGDASWFAYLALKLRREISQLARPDSRR